MPLFEGKEIRCIIIEGEKWFSIVDIIEILTGSSNPLAYWVMLKNQLLKDYSGNPFWNKLEMQSTDGKTKRIDCANTEGMIRINLNIPSPKGELLQMWLIGLYSK